MSGIAARASASSRRPSDYGILDVPPLSNNTPTNPRAFPVVKLDVCGVPLVARITRRSAAKLQLQPGMKVWAQIKAVALVG